MVEEEWPEEIDTEALLYVLGDVPGRLSPYVPTPSWLRRFIAQLLSELMEKGAPRVVYEPGCGAGDAAEAIETITRPRYYIGLEIDPDLAKKARSRIELGDVVVGDLRSPPLRSRPLLVYAYLLPRPLTFVLENAPRGSVVVSLEYEAEEGVRGVELQEKVEVDSVLTRHRVYVYVKKDSG